MKQQPKKEEPKASQPAEETKKGLLEFLKAKWLKKINVPKTQESSWMNQLRSYLDNALYEKACDFLMGLVCDSVGDLKLQPKPASKDATHLICVTNAFSMAFSKSSVSSSCSQTSNDLSRIHFPYWPPQEPQTPEEIALVNYFVHVYEPKIDQSKIDQPPKIEQSKIDQLSKIEQRTKIEESKIRRFVAESLPDLIESDFVVDSEPKTDSECAKTNKDEVKFQVQNRQQKALECYYSGMFEEALKLFGHVRWTSFLAHTTGYLRNEPLAFSFQGEKLSKMLLRDKYEQYGAIADLSFFIVKEIQRVPCRYVKLVELLSVALSISKSLFFAISTFSFSILNTWHVKDSSFFECVTALASTSLPFLDSSSVFLDSACLNLNSDKTDSKPPLEVPKQNLKDSRNFALCAHSPFFDAGCLFSFPSSEFFKKVPDVAQSIFSSLISSSEPQKLETQQQITFPQDVSSLSYSVCRLLFLRSILLVVVLRLALCNDKSSVSQICSIIVRNRATVSSWTFQDFHPLLTSRWETTRTNILSFLDSLLEFAQNESSTRFP